MDDKTYRELFENSSSSDESSPTKGSPAKLTRPVRDSIMGPWQATFSQLQMNERSYRGIFENSPLPDCSTLATEPVQPTVSRVTRPWQYTFTKLHMDEHKYKKLFEKCRLPDSVTKGPVQNTLAMFSLPELEGSSASQPTCSQVNMDERVQAEILEKIANSPPANKCSSLEKDNISERTLRTANFKKLQLNDKIYSQIFERSSSEDSIPTNESELELKSQVEDSATAKDNKTLQIGIVKEYTNKAFGPEHNSSAKISNIDFSFLEDSYDKYSNAAQNNSDTGVAQGSLTIDFSSLHGFTDLDNNNLLHGNLSKAFGFLNDSSMDGHLNQNSLVSDIWPVRDRMIGASDSKYKSSTEFSMQGSEASSSMQAAISLVTQALDASESYDGMTPERLNTWKRIADRRTPEREVFRYPRRTRVRRLPLTPYLRRTNDQSDNDENSSPN